MEQRCRDCIYFKPREPDEELAGDGNGKCRRYPPILIAGIDSEAAEYITGCAGCEVDFFSQPNLARYKQWPIARNSRHARFAW